MSAEVMAAVKARNITRICHFTPSRNLQHIAAGGQGILSTATLQADERKVYERTDLLRLDGHKTHICCSIEYPNAWYFAKAREREKLFPDWVVLLIDPLYLWSDDTLFCPRNAAANYGRLLQRGATSFERLFAQTVSTGDRYFARGPRQNASTPTDQQAEVLVRDRIAREHIQAVGVRSEDQARRERVRLRTNGLNPDEFKFVVVPYMYDKDALNLIIKNGVTPPETVYVPKVIANA